MADDDVRQVAKNAANIANLQQEIKELDERLRDVERCVTQMKASLAVWAALGGIASGVVTAIATTMITQYLLGG